jgi:hypothetical protein
VYVKSVDFAMLLQLCCPSDSNREGGRGTSARPQDSLTIRGVARRQKLKRFETDFKPGRSATGAK